MGVFDDKKLEQLDWMTQMTETIESELNVALANLPNEVIFDAKTIFSHINSSYYGSISIRVDEVIRLLIANLEKSKELSWDDRRKLEGCFKFEVAPDTIIDL